MSTKHAPYASLAVPTDLEANSEPSLFVINPPYLPNVSSSLVEAPLQPRAQCGSDDDIGSHAGKLSSCLPS